MKIGLFHTVQWPEGISDDELRAIMEPHQATIEAARRVERFARSLAPADLVAIEPQLPGRDTRLTFWLEADPGRVHAVAGRIPGQRIGEKIR